MLDRITPVLLTLNEEANIGRTLSKLGWARDIVIVDSGSTDGTLGVLYGFAQVRIFRRPFDTHAAQWNYAIEQTGISTEWVLALDADYVLSDELVDELQALMPGPKIAGYEVRFRYRSLGVELWRSLYPPVTVLYRRAHARYVEDGHTQRVVVAGAVGRIKASIYHDDRKPLSSWRTSQERYCRQEAEKLGKARWSTLRWTDRIRKLIVVAPVAVALYVLFGQGAILLRYPGLYYAFQRTYAEWLLSAALLRMLVRSRRAERP